jgi:hypothetical protein
MVRGSQRFYIYELLLTRWVDGVGRHCDGESPRIKNGRFGHRNDVSLDYRLHQLGW